MTIRFLPLLLSIAPMAALAQSALPPPLAGMVRIDLKTSDGTIILDLDRAHAPITTANFLHYVDTGRLDGTSFYRATKVAPGYGLIQGGTRNDPRRLYPPIKLEPTSQTGLSHIDGSISMARYAPNSATGDFFITIGALPSMDANPTQPGDNQGFAVFGHVVEGMDVVHKILNEPTSATAGDGAMKGQMIARPVAILSAHREP